MILRPLLRKKSMAYYHDLVTEESWRELTELRKRVDFVLIGGWAVYLFTHSLKSKDIDILVGYDQLTRIKRWYTLSKNDRLHKYEAIRGQIQIDIYLPHYSMIGIPVETLLAHTVLVEGFRVLSPEYLIVLKLATLSERGRTPKGRKDFLDIISLLLALPPEAGKAARALVQHHHLGGSTALFHTLPGETTAIPELSLNPHQVKKLKTSNNVLYLRSYLPIWKPKANFLISPFHKRMCGRMK